MLAEKGTRFLTIGINCNEGIYVPHIQFSISEQWGFSLSDCLALILPFKLIKSLVLLFISITITRFIYFCIETTKNVQELIVLIKTSTTYTSRIKSRFLKLMIKKRRVEVKVSSLTCTPIGIWSV